jgi:hypothetical protein
MCALNQFGLSPEIPGQAFPIHQPMRFTTRAHLRCGLPAPSAATRSSLPPFRPTIPRRRPPPSPCRPPQHSEENGMEGGGEAYQALEDPPRRQRNLSRALPHSPLQLHLWVVVSPTLFSSQSSFLFYCQVMIIRGKDKGETGLIKRVIRSQNRVIVEGKNLVICCPFPLYVFPSCSR